MAQTPRTTRLQAFAGQVWPEDRMAVRLLPNGDTELRSLRSGEVVKVGSEADVEGFIRLIAGNLKRELTDIG